LVEFRRAGAKRSCPSFFTARESSALLADQWKTLQANVEGGFSGGLPATCTEDGDGSLRRG